MVVIYPPQKKKKKKNLFANELWVKWVEGRVMGSKSIHCKISPLQNYIVSLQSRASLGSYRTIIFAIISSSIEHTKRYIVSVVILDCGVRRFWGLVWKSSSSSLWVECGECSLLMIFLSWLLSSYLFTSFKTLPFRRDGFDIWMENLMHLNFALGFEVIMARMCKWLRHFLKIMDSKQFYWYWRWWMRYHFSKIQLSFRCF